MITIEVLTKIFSVLLVIALASERLIEVAKPLIEKVSIKWQPSIKISVAILVGFGLAALFHFDILAELFVLGIAPIVGYLLAGLVSSAGSSVIHPILEWLKTLGGVKSQVVTETTKNEANSSIKTTEIEVMK
jgi:hypothetical protein